MGHKDLRADLPREYLQIADNLMRGGSGTPQRAFRDADDLAPACVMLTESGYDSPPLSIGSGSNVSICELTGAVVQEAGLRGRVAFDESGSTASRSNGSIHRPSKRQAGEPRSNALRDCVDAPWRTH